VCVCMYVSVYVCVCVDLLLALFRMFLSSIVGLFASTSGILSGRPLSLREGRECTQGGCYSLQEGGAVVKIYVDLFV
jgi:hypothetical protein